MHWIKRNFRQLLSCYPVGFAPPLVVFAMWAFVFLRLTVAQQLGQRTFSSPEGASHALYVAFQTGDDKALLDILGPDSKQIVASGDDFEDLQHRSEFVEKYEERHQLVQQSDGTAALYIGAENRAFAIPLVNKDGIWHFDTDAANQKILLRRIAKNELATVQVCYELVDAEKQYYERLRGADGVQHYAEKFVSNEGEHNGLFWLGADDEFASPIDPRVANAGSRDGIASQLRNGPIPFQGYYFRILTRQGSSAAGGAEDYVVNGKMIRGFAFLAYPAEYRSLGVMTFVVNQDRIVYEKDLGTRTIELAQSMTEYNPDSSWRRSE